MHKKERNKDHFHTVKGPEVTNWQNEKTDTKVIMALF